MSNEKQSLDFDALGDKHKKLEGMSESNLIPGVPVIARLDGRAFHTLTRTCEKPYDLGFITAMEKTAKALLQEFNASFAYVQSDEITLGWKLLDMFDGRVQKLTSSMSAYASVIFSREWVTEVVPTFDCRIWQVADLKTVAENVMWREMDASKNSVNMAAHALFHQSQIDNMSTVARIALLETEAGFYWNKLEPRLKRGSIFTKVKVFRELTEEEMETIPANHRPNGPVRRSEIQRLDIPQLTKVFNKVGVLFDGEKAEPILNL